MDLIHGNGHILETTQQGKRLKSTRFTKNPRYDWNGLYSYNTKIAEIDFENETIRQVVWASVSSQRHYNWLRNMLVEDYGFTELKAQPS